MVRQERRKMPKFIHVDLFSGIGGFSYAVDQVWDDVEHVFCEIDLFCQQVIKKHWEGSVIYGDIKELTFMPTYDMLDTKGGNHGIPTKSEIRRSRKSLRQGNVNRGNSRVLSDNAPSNAQNIKAPGSCIQKQLALWEEESFLSGDKSVGSCPQHSRAGYQEGNIDKTDDMSSMQKDGEQQRDRGSSSRLHKATGCDVAMSTMSS